MNSRQYSLAIFCLLFCLLSLLYFSNFIQHSFVLVVGAIAAFVLSRALFYVPSGHLGVIFHRVHGVKPQAYPPGLHLTSPINEFHNLIDVQPFEKLVTIPLQTEDSMRVLLSVRVLCHPDAAHVIRFYLRLGSVELVRHSYIPALTKEIATKLAATKDSRVIWRSPQQFVAVLHEEMAAKATQHNILVPRVTLDKLSTA
eukprot:TRINITY_DN6825_c0_g2_i6.p1 TRINITY_DN6825_c0_g2~~TRINITY_DN6825_c0_g2_i6.p1  ORF type:complete len:199 (-),score=30.02 TRINITY_DN6825_c0_g2_i6:74-670(-)